MKKRKICTPKDLHISYMCEYIDDYHDICKYAKELIGIGYKSKGLLKLSEIAKNKDIKNFDKNYSDFINDFDLSDITYENAGLVLFEILSEEFLKDEISLEEYMENFYYLYYVSNSNLQSKNFESNRLIREINEQYKEYNLLNLGKDKLELKEFNSKLLLIDNNIKEIIKELEEKV